MKIKKEIEYVSDTPEKHRYNRMLSDGIHDVWWNSIDGPKHMTVTRDRKHIPVSWQVSWPDDRNQTEKGAKTVRAYSPDRHGWRSFHTDDVTGFD